MSNFTSIEAKNVEKWTLVQSFYYDGKKATFLLNKGRYEKLKNNDPNQTAW